MPAKLAGLPISLEEESNSTKKANWKILKYFHHSVVTLFLVWKLTCAIVTFFTNDFVGYCNMEKKKLFLSCINSNEFLVIAKKFGFEHTESIMSEASMLAMGTGLIFIYFYIVKGEQVRKIVRDLDGISLRIVGGDPEGSMGYSDMLGDDARGLARLGGMFYISSFLCPLLYTMLGPLTAYVQGEYGRLPVPISCEFEQGFGTGMYELMTFFQFLGYSLPAYLKLGNEFVLFRILRIQISIFKYLSDSIRLLGDKMNEDRLHFETNLSLWITIHQDVLRTVHELYALYSPLVIVYYVVLISFTVSMLFYNSNAVDKEFIQSSSMTGYIVITTIQFYILSHLADELSEESERVAVEAYCTPWHVLPKKDKDAMRIIIAMANKPIFMTAYKAPIFNVNRPAFQGFIVNMISTFMGMRTVMET